MNSSCQDLEFPILFERSVHRVFSERVTRYRLGYIRARILVIVSLSACSGTQQTRLFSSS